VRMPMRGINESPVGSDSRISVAVLQCTYNPESGEKCKNYLTV